MSFSKYLTELRKKQNLTNIELAEKFNMSESQIRNIIKARTKTPPFSFFNLLVEYTGEDPVEAAYKVFFGYEDDISYPIKEISKVYLANKYAEHCEIIPAVSFNDSYDKEYLFEGIYWIAGFTHYKVLLDSFDRKKYLAALRTSDKKENLKKLIFSETYFIEKLCNIGQIKEVR
ncbi:MAG: helix-turn-helix transcriptional regulator, partial [Erysipelotrichaceae bacterium]|nr:helix-turn-helix transcriptional regulator [Erysipelotrichaceae bacterium]